MSLKISIIGAGKVAYHLTKTFYYKKEIKIQQLYNRSAFSSEFNSFEVEKTNSISSLRPADICIIAVNDEAITEVSASLPFQEQLVVHTSGNTPIEAIHPKNRRGVFYPLQSFSKNTQVDFSTVPICLEADNPNDINSLLMPLAQLISTKIYELSSYQRRILHLSAVFMNNFTNHLIAISQKICETHQVPFEILQPLLAETFAKLQQIPAHKAQTGPAIRGDKKTIESHLAMLSEDEKKIYQIITNSIINTYGRKEL